MFKAKKPQKQQKTNDNQQLKSYAASFCTAVVSGVAGETYMLIQSRKLNTQNLLAPAYRDACVISGVQQVAKDFSKNTLKKSPYLYNLSVKNPFIFGAMTGLPMWALTRLVATPLQNSRKTDVKQPFDGLFKSIINDVGYHTVKNGIDEYFAAKVFPKVLPQLPNFATQKLVEASLAGLVGGASYVISWPYKGVLTGQNISEAAKLMLKNTPKVAVKKLTYTLVRPQFANLIK
ncbi:hypothetical protein GPJ56_004371 [Histomonas meleagridis]|uniref:uncharacterized protein n=1 Tax=Histomonas meleagridis TaxID=135588 RepID=UPI00355A6BFE|nr:hypothetical protein GPJ56_004371 [Histomonas meleagridis]KAH0799984.1 hypothetical protein GO595_007096 [Histomonas meleagridis]